MEVAVAEYDASEEPLDDADIEWDTLDVGEATGDADNDRDPLDVREVTGDTEAPAVADTVGEATPLATAPVQQIS